MGPKIQNFFYKLAIKETIIKLIRIFFFIILKTVVNLKNYLLLLPVIQQK